MAGGQFDILAHLRADTSDFSGKMRGAGADMDRMTGSAGNAGSSISASLGSRASNAMAAATGASTMLAVGLGAVAAAAGVAAFKGVMLAAKYEQTQMAFTQFLGSAEKADAFLREMNDFAAKTPFEIDGLLNSARMMMAFGFEAKKVKPMLTAVGDAVSALGGGKFELERVTRALGQMKAKGKVSAEEMMQLAELGIPAWELLADAIGTDIPTAMKKASSGAIPAGVAIEGLISGMTKKFGGMMDKQSATIMGMWSTISDNGQLILRSIGTELLETFDVKAKMKKFADWITKFNGALLEGAKFGDFIKQKLAPFSNIIGVIAGALAVGLVPAIWAAAKGLFFLIQPLLPFLAIGAAIGGMVMLLINSFGGWQAMMDKLQPTFLIFQTAFAIFGDVADLALRNFKANILGAFGGNTMSLAEGFTALLDKIAIALLSGAAKLREWWLDGGSAKTTEFFQNLVGVVKKVGEGLVWLKDNWKEVSAVVVTVAAGFMAFQNSAKIIETVTKVAGVFGKVWNFVGLAFKFPHLMMSLLTGSVGELSTIFAGLLAAAWPVVAVIAAVAAVAYFLWQNWDKVLSFISKMAGPVMGILKGALAGIMEAVGPLMESLLNLWGALKPVLMIVGGIIAGVLVVALGLLFGVFAALGPMIKGFITMLTGIINFVSGILNVVVGVVQMVFGIIVGLFTGNFDLLTAGANRFAAGFMQAIQGIIQFFAGLWGFVAGGLVAFFNGVVLWFTNLWDVLVGHSIVPDMINAIIMWFLKLPGRVLGAVGSMVVMAISKFASFYSSVISWIVKTVLGIGVKLGLISPAMRDKLMAAFNTAKGIVSKFVSIGASIADGIRNGLSNTWSGLVSKLKGLVNLLPDTVKKLLGIHSPSKVFMQLGQFTMQGFVNGIEKMKPAIEAVTLNTVGTMVPNTMNAAPTAITAGSGSGNRTTNFDLRIDNVTVANDMDIEDLADELHRKLIEKMRQEGER